MYIKIGGVEVNYQVNTIDLDDAVGQRSTASFAVVDRLGNMRFKKGQPVGIYGKTSTGDVPAVWEMDDLTTNWEE